MRRIQAQSGFSLVEAVIVAGLAALVFSAIFASFQYSLQLINDARAKLSALSVASDRLESIRSLPYDDVGVIAGFPAGNIPQTSTTTLNGIEFQERVRIDYFDDPAEGTSTADTNGITTDYKKVRVEYTWWIGNATSSLALTSIITPRSIETNVGGGTVRINVLDADSTPLPGADVRLFSSSSTFSYDVINPTDASGAALFSVPADSGYQVEVTANIAGNQYSTDGTYVATTSNPNPVVAPFAVLESDVSTLTFQIGELSDMEIDFFTSITEGVRSEEFVDLSGVASSTDVAIDTGDLVLADTLGTYEPTGIAYLDPITPASLERWEVARVAVDLPTTDTTFALRFYTGASSTGYTLIPNSDLPGNSIGFTDNIINLSELDVSYTSIVPGFTLSTTDLSETPEIDELQVFWREGDTPLTGYAFDMRGVKVIGTDASSSPIYKLSTAGGTDGSGRASFPDLEFDGYALTNTPGYDIVSACPGYPIPHEAGVDTMASVLLAPDQASTLRVHVMDGLGRSLPGIEVNLDRPGYDVTLTTDSCGQAFFSGGVTDDSDYVMTVGGTGYSTEVINPFAVSGDTQQVVTLFES
jgi:type II secretory pathway pseudopilin PulG